MKKIALLLVALLAMMCVPVALGAMAAIGGSAIGARAAHRRLRGRHPGHR